MSILFLHKVFPFGGAERVTLDVCNLLAERGYDVAVMTPDHRKDGYPRGAEVRFEVIEMPPCNLKCSHRAEAFVRDYIVEHRVTTLVSYRELLYMPRLKRETGVRFVYVLHSMVGYEFVGNRGPQWLQRWFYRSKYRRVWKQCDIYGVLCPQYRDEVATMVGTTADDTKLHVLPNPVTRCEAPKMEKEKECLFVGRLTRRDKRVDRLVRIWASAERRLPSWHLTIVGDGPEQERLEQLAQRLGAERITFEGHQQDMQPYYDRAAMLCMTSSFEGWPMVVAEAQQNGVVPMVFDSFAGCHDMISTPYEGIVIPSFDEAAYAEALVSLAQDSVRRERMSLAVVAKSRTYTPGRVIQAWEAVIGTRESEALLNP